MPPAPTSPPPAWGSVSASRLVALLAATAAGVLACGGDDPCESVAGPAVVASVDLSPDDPRLALGETLQLVAVPRSACGNRVADASVAWSSGSPAVASVSGNGMVTAEGLGTAVITAASEGVSAAVTVTVTPPQVATVEVIPGAATIAVNETVTLTATPRDADGNVLAGRPVTWASGSPGVASVAATGVVTGQATGGPVLITATIEGIEGSASITVTPEPAPRLVFQAQPQDGTAGVPLATVRVAVVNSLGEVITDDPGDAITMGLGANPGGATLAGSLEVKPVNGVAEFSGLSLDKVGTGYTLVASRADASPGTSTPFAIAPGAPARLSFTTDPGTTAAGAPLRPIPAVQVADAFGNPVPVDGRNVTVGLAANPHGGTLGGTRTMATVGGVASFPDLSLDVAGAGYALSATSAGLSSAAGATFAITPGPAAALRFVQQPEDGTVGVAIAPPVTVELVDALGNPTGAGTTAVTVALGQNPSGATLGGTATRNAVGGVATFGDLTVSEAGQYTLTAAAAGLTGAESQVFEVVTVRVTSLQFTVQPVTGTAGLPMAPVAVTLRDAGGNVAIGATEPVTVSLGTNPTGAPLQGTLTVTPVAGVATFTDLRIDAAATGYRLSAVTEGVDPVASAAFSILPGAPTRLRFISGTPNPREDRVINPPVQVAVSDAFDNTVPVSGVAVTIALGQNPEEATLSGTLVRGTTDGVATFNDLRISKDGQGYTLVASSPLLTSAETAPFNVRN